MCGVCGINFDTTWEGDSVALMRELLLGIEHRGKDATGVAWFGRNDGVNILKDAIPASEFVKGELNRMGKNAKTVIAHTRWETQGDRKFNRNNHPVAVGEPGQRTIGVHNGMISNDRTIHRKLAEDYGHKSEAEVDSEALFAYVHYMGYTKMGGVDGSFAAGILKEAEPNRLLLIRGYGSPLMAAKCKYGWLFASEAQALRRVEAMVGGFEVDEDKESADYGKTFIREFDPMTWGLFEKGSVIDGGEIDNSTMTGWSTYKATGYNGWEGYGAYTGLGHKYWEDTDADAKTALLLADEAEMANKVTELKRGKGRGGTGTTKDAVRIPTGLDSDETWSDALIRKVGEAVRTPDAIASRVQSDNCAFIATYYLRGEETWLHVYENGWIKTGDFARPFPRFDDDAQDIYEISKQIAEEAS